jgi:hypothetical protein
LGANLLFNAASDTVYLIYNRLRSPVITEISKKNKNKIRQTFPGLTDNEVRNLIAEDDKRKLAYMARVGRYLFNSIGVANGIYLYLHQLNNFYNNGVNPFALSFPEGYSDCPSSTILCRPMTTPIFLTLYTITLLHNLRELSFFKDPASFIERGDIPFFSFFNAYGKIGLLKTITGRWEGVGTAELEKLAFHKKAYEQHINNKFGMSIPKLREFAASFIALDADNQLDRNAENYPGMQKVTQLYLNYLETVVRYDDYVATHKHHLSGLNWFLPLFLRYYGNYQLYESALLTLKNVICYFKDIPVIEAIDEQPQTHKEDNTSKILKGKKKKYKEPTLIKEEARNGGEKTSPLSLSSQIKPESLNNKQSKDCKEPLSKPKIKTRKSSNLDFVARSKEDKGKQKISNTPIDLKAGLRNKGLDTVKSLRDQYPIKVNVIQRAINGLEKFLNGKSEKIQGSEYRLVWHLNGKRYAMKYEIPHGWDSANFAGNKLNRILNVLEIGYLVGLNEEQVNAYIESNERYNLLRLAKFIRYLALNPAK